MGQFNLELFSNKKRRMFKIQLRYYEYFSQLNTKLSLKEAYEN